MNDTPLTVDAIANHAFKFLSLVMGLAVVKWFAGWEQIYNNQAYSYFSENPYHFLWSILTFLYIIQNWWGILKYHEHITKRPFFFLVYTLDIGLNFAIATIIFPSESIPATGYDFFYSIRTSLFGILIIKVSFSILIAFFLVPNSLFRKSLKLESQIFRAAGIILLIIGVLTANQIYHSIMIICVLGISIRFFTRLEMSEVQS